eukprot:3713245-Prymnesium_polylepis.1
MPCMRAPWAFRCRAVRGLASGGAVLPARRHVAHGSRGWRRACWGGGLVAAWWPQLTQVSASAPAGGPRPLRLAAAP